MNPDYIIGSKQPHVLYADYVGDTSKLSNADETDGSAAAAKTASAGTQTPEAEHELTFDDFIDIINPLQHIPVVNYIYRAITGDKISGFAQIAGGGLFGGPLGLVGGVVEAAFNDETGHGPAETMVADILGLKDHATMVAEADRSPKPAPDMIDRMYASVIGDDEDEPASGTLNAQVAQAMETGPKMLDAQVASAMPAPKTLDTQLAEANLPPVGPSPVQVAQGKAPFGGIMDMDLVNKARAGAPNIQEPGNVAIAASEQANPAAATPIAAVVGNTQEVPEGTKFYSLGKAKRSSETNIAMPTYSGPDVRLKPISRMAVNSGKAVGPAPIQIPAGDAHAAEARKILGLPEAQSPVASALTPDQADLLPAYGQGSQPLPAGLIEDMMKMGLDKYQKGLSNGSLGTQPSIDVRG
jgi:hypothetical protein